MSKSEPTSKSTAKTNAVKALKFPELPLTRITEKVWFDTDLVNSQSWHKLQPSENDLAELQKVIDNPNDHLFEIYERVDSDLVQQELTILKAHYDKASLEQKYLVHLFIKPSVIFSPQYQDFVDGKSTFDIADCLYNEEVKKVSYKIDRVARRRIDYFNEQAIAKTVLKCLPYPLQIALLTGNYIECYFDKYVSEYYSQVSSLLSCLLNFMSSQTAESVTWVLQKYAPYFARDSDLPRLMQPIIGYQAVPYFLNAFNTKTNKGLMKTYFEKHPQTVLDETVYLLFTKQTDEPLKKAKKNAKVFFDYLIENHKTELIATLQAYDQQLDKPILEPFLANYQSHQLALQHQDNATIQHDIAQGTDPTGTPVVLTNDDWQKLTKKRTITLPSDIHLAELPPLIIASTGQPLALDAYARLLKMLMLSEAGDPFALLMPTLAYFTPESQTALADKLWSRFYVPDSKNKWRILASGLLYHPTLDDKVWDYMKMQESDPTARAYLRHSFTTLAEQAIIRHQLAKDGINAEQNRNLGNQALRMLIKLSQKARTTLRPVAEKELKRYADSMGLTADDLADRVLPTLGLDAQGKRVFDFGNRQFTMRLNAELEPEFVDNTGKKLKKLPTPNTNDDEQQASQAVDDFKAMKKALTAFKREDVPRLELMMVNQRRIAFADFEQFFIKNPLMLRITYQLIWGVYDKENKDKLLTPFRVVETGEVLDIDDNDLTVADDRLIGLVHPIDLTDEQIAKFGQSLQDDNIIQPIMQLARPIYRLTDEEKTQGKITRFDQETFATGSLIGLKNKGWIDGMGSGGVCEYYDKTIANADWHFNFTGYQMWGGVPSDDKGQQIGTISVPSGANAVSISEFLYVMDSMARLVE